MGRVLEDCLPGATGAATVEPEPKLGLKTGVAGADFRARCLERLGAAERGTTAERLWPHTFPILRGESDRDPLCGSIGHLAEPVDLQGPDGGH